MIKIIKNVVFVASIFTLSQAALAGTYQECISTANEINQTAPQQIDKITILVNATCKEEGKKVILSYSYMLDTENLITKQDIESMKPSQINAVCTDPQLKSVLDVVFMEFSYSGRDRKFIGANRINKKDCRLAR